MCTPDVVMHILMRTENCRRGVFRRSSLFEMVNIRTFKLCSSCLCHLIYSYYLVYLGTLHYEHSYVVPSIVILPPQNMLFVLTSCLCCTHLQQALAGRLVLPALTAFAVYYSFLEYALTSSNRWSKNFDKRPHRRVCPQNCPSH